VLECLDVCIPRVCFLRMLDTHTTWPSPRHDCFEAVDRPSIPPCKVVVAIGHVAHCPSSVTSTLRFSSST
jgi:hypothetical protein